MRRWRVRIILHLCDTDTDTDTDTEITSLLVDNLNISLLFPPDTFMVIVFAGALQQASAYCVHLSTELFAALTALAAAAGH